MNRFLRETWELFYWAMFFPSKLQQRINDLAPYKDSKYRPRRDIKSYEILFPKLIHRFTANFIQESFNFRFFAQYLLLLLCLSFPLIINIAIQGRGIDWLQIPLILLTAYGASYKFSFYGLPVPLIWLIVHVQQPEFWLTGLNEALNILPPLSQIAVGLITGTVVLIITNVLIYWFLQNNHLVLSRTIFFIGGTLSFCVGSWLASENWLFVLSASVWSSVIFLINQNELKRDHDIVFMAGDVVAVAAGVAVGMVGFVAAEVAFRMVAGMVGFVAAGVAVGMVAGVTVGVASGMVGAVAVGMVGAVAGVAAGVTVGMVVGVAGAVAGAVAGVTSLPLPLFILVCILVAFSFAAEQKKWRSITASGILTVLGLGNLGLNSLLTIPITLLVFYYRLFPDYLLSTPISLSPSLPFIKHFRLKPLQTLKLLPPYTTLETHSLSTLFITTFGCSNGDSSQSSSH